MKKYILTCIILIAVALSSKGQKQANFQKYFKHKHDCQMEVVFNKNLQIWMEEKNSCKKILEEDEIDQSHCDVIKAVNKEDVNPIIQGVLNGVNDGRCHISFLKDESYKTTEDDGALMYVCLQFSEVEKAEAKEYIKKLSED